MSGKIVHTIYLTSESHLLCHEGDTLFPLQEIATTPLHLKRSFLSLLSQKRQLISPISVGDNVIEGETLVFYPRPFLQFLFAMSIFFSDEDVSVHQKLSHFLLKQKTKRSWWLPLFVLSLKSELTGVVELLSPEGNLLVVKQVSGSKSVLAHTYGEVTSITKQRITIHSPGKILTAAFGYGSRKGGVLTISQNSEDNIFFEEGLLTKDKINDISRLGYIGVVANGVSLDVTILLHSPEYNLPFSIIAFSIVTDESSLKKVIRARELSTNSRVTLLPHLHPEYTSQLSAVIMHKEGE